MREIQNNLNASIEILKNLLEINENVQKNSFFSDLNENQEKNEECEDFRTTWLKQPFVKEYNDFMTWAWGENEIDTPEKMILSFSKQHPNLPLIKHIDNSSFNSFENILIISLQAMKFYLKDKI